MEAKVAQSLQFSTWNDLEKKRKPNGLLHFSPRSREQKRLQILIPSRLQPTGTATWHKPEALQLYVVDGSDALIEQAVGGTSVAEIFKLYGEGLFRDNETEVLRKLSTMHRLVVSTGGGAVIRPINWKYMQKGISVWLDVPLEALARRIADVGTESRPLLHQEPGDAYAKAFTRLSTLWEERSEAYANANARVSLENIAAKLGTSDVCSVTPTVIAIEVLQQIESFLKN